MKSNTSRHKPPARKAAAKLIVHGYAVCRIEPSEKRPTYTRWATHSVDPAGIQSGDGIGLVCGPILGTTGHALVCIDLDSRSAVRLADKYLPDTEMIEGRKGKPRSHRWYRVPLASIPAEEQSHAAQCAPLMKREYGHTGPRTVSFRDREGTELLRFIGAGGQAVVPPSMHASGESREWENDTRGEPATVKFKALLKAVRRLARKWGWVPKAEVNATAGTNMTADTSDAVSTTVDPFLTYRINRYLDSMPASISGQAGHDRTYHAACVLVWGFALSETAALKFLSRFNARCRPHWSEAELRHKVRDAVNVTDHTKPRGHLV